MKRPIRSDTSSETVPSLARFPGSSQRSMAYSLSTDCPGAETGEKGFGLCFPVIRAIGRPTRSATRYSSAFLGY